MALLLYLIDDYELIKETLINLIRVKSLNYSLELEYKIETGLGSFGEEGSRLKGTRKDRPKGAEPSPLPTHPLHNHSILLLLFKIYYYP